MTSWPASILRPLGIKLIYGYIHIEYTWQEVKFGLPNLPKLVVRTIHAARQPAQPSQLACVWPAATWFDDSDGRMRVPNSLTRPHAGRLSVFCFKTCDTRSKPKPLSFSANYYKFWTKFGEISSRFGPDPSDSTRSRHYLTKSRPDLDGSG